MLWASGVCSFRKHFRFPPLAHPQDLYCLVPAYPPQPHLTPFSPSLTFSCSSSKGTLFLPTVLCTCCSICLKCFPLTLYLPNTFLFISPHQQTFLPQGSSELPPSLGSLFLCPWHPVSGVPLPQLPRHCPYAFCLPCEDRVCHVPCQVPTPGTTPST